MMLLDYCDEVWLLERSPSPCCAKCGRKPKETSHGTLWLAVADRLVFVCPTCVTKIAKDLDSPIARAFGNVVPSSPDIFNECDLDPTHDEKTCPRCVAGRARRDDRIAAAMARGLSYEPNAYSRSVRVCGCLGCGDGGCASDVNKVCGNWHTLDDRGLCRSCAPHHVRET